MYRYTRTFNQQDTADTLAATTRTERRLVGFTDELELTRAAPGSELRMVAISFSRELMLQERNAIQKASIHRMYDLEHNRLM